MKAEYLRKLLFPLEIKEMLPLPDKYRNIVDTKIRETEAILSSDKENCSVPSCSYAGCSYSSTYSEDASHTEASYKDSARKLLIIGPCSADNEESVIEYLNRLRPIQEQVKSKLLIIPRLYTNKPRTTGDGYKGMLHQPAPSSETDFYNGIIATRRLHIRAVTETGFACADEMLYPDNYEYLDDLIAYVAVGARSVENQQHRLTASALNAPVGMKNPTSGDFSVMLNAIHAAQNPHTFMYRGWEIKSSGNKFAHAILRGYTNKHGEPQPNYHYEDLLRLADMYVNNESYLNPSAIIDVNHANSGKKPFEQPHIVMDIINSMKYNSTIRKLVKGFMVESYLVDGCQSVGGSTYGQSITDPCLGWDKTVRLISDIAENI